MIRLYHKIKYHMISLIEVYRIYKRNILNSLGNEKMEDGIRRIKYREGSGKRMKNIKHLML